MADSQRKERHWLRLRTRREALPFLLIVVLTALFSFGAPRVLPFLTVFENWADDLRTGLMSEPLPQDSNIVVLAITEQTLALKELAVRSPIDRDWLAKQLQAVVDAEALAVGIDILFDQATESARDDRLMAVLASSDIPIVTAWAGGKNGLSPAQTDYLAAFTANNPPGSIVLRLDAHDGIARHVAGSNDQGVPAFSRRLAAAAGIIGEKDDFRIAYRRNPGDGKPAIPVYPAEVASIMPAQWFAGKIILIGADLPNSDRYPTPLSVLYGAEEGTQASANTTPSDAATKVATPRPRSPRRAPSPNSTPITQSRMAPAKPSTWP
ncbi:MAG: CHASE2 domain-containing protein [Alphaproteobacteria bacterium]|jgi:CHASE2 domain-containing sensor protein|nr:CHASE2 domain-containing protein [Alphaproteobacteria bacterium]